jgi:hypothetical protein
LLFHVFIRRFSAVRETIVFLRRSTKHIHAIGLQLFGNDDLPPFICAKRFWLRSSQTLEFFGPWGQPKARIIDKQELSKKNGRCAAQNGFGHGIFGLRKVVPINDPSNFDRQCRQQCDAGTSNYDGHSLSILANHKPILLATGTSTKNSATFL